MSHSKKFEINKIAISDDHPHKKPTPHKEGEPFRASRHLDARNHYPQIKHHTPPPKQGNNKTPTPESITTSRGEGRHTPPNGNGPRACCLKAQ